MINTLVFLIMKQYLHFCRLLSSMPDFYQLILRIYFQNTEKFIIIKNSEMAGHEYTWVILVELQDEKYKVGSSTI